VVFSRNISDNWKEIALTNYSGQLAKTSVYILGIAISIIFIIIFIDIMAPGFLEFIANMKVLIAAILLTVVYAVCRNKLLK
tara:strand:- start:49 stop:291 length:243 start_codon:yes stop_codon:yes gene_type:complete